MFGDASAPSQGEFLLLLWKREDGTCGVAVPLVDGDIRGVLEGTSQGWAIRAAKLDPLPSLATLLLVATGPDPLELVLRAMSLVAERLKTFQLRTQKPVPKWVDYLGWCTWDAFEREVTAEKVLEGLASFQVGGFGPRFVILDDGWQDERERRLWSFGTQPKRFPQGLKPLIDQARRDYGVKLFGVWHALQGYWNGVHPGGELAEKYPLVEGPDAPGSAPGEPPEKRSMVHPEATGRFLDDYHRTLREQGVDMVKVDNQGSMDWFATAEVPPTSTVRAYQYGLQDAEKTHFHGESLHCMSNSTDAVYHLRSANVWRSSQDFFPLKPLTHGLHVFDNAINSLWVQTFALPDWDMFQSNHYAGAFHAAARAISGGPVYVSDKPDGHDFKLLAKLVVSDGTVLRCEQPALPGRENLFEDGRAEPCVTKITNFNRVAGLQSPIGVLGLFNCYFSNGEPAPVLGEYSAADVPGIRADQFALFHHGSGRVLLAEQGTRFPIKLEGLGFELVTVSPVENGVALFGLIDKFNSSRGVESARWVSPGELEVELRDGGRLGWFSAKATLKAQFNDAPLEVSSKENLTWVRMPEGNRATVRLRFG